MPTTNGYGHCFASHFSNFALPAKISNFSSQATSTDRFTRFQPPRPGTETKTEQSTEPIALRSETIASALLLHQMLRRGAGFGYSGRCCWFESSGRSSRSAFQSGISLPDCRPATELRDQTAFSSDPKNAYIVKTTSVSRQQYALTGSTHYSFTLK